MKKADVKVGREYRADTGYGSMQVGVAVEHGWGRGTWRRESDRGLGSGVLMAFPRADIRWDDEVQVTKYAVDFRIVQLNMIQCEQTLEDFATRRWLDAEHRYNASVRNEAERAYRARLRSLVAEELEAQTGKRVYVSEYDADVKVPFRALVKLLGLEDAR